MKFLTSPYFYVPVIGLIILCIYGYNKLGWFKAVTIPNAAKPNPSDCAGGRINAREKGDIVAGKPQCTKPTYAIADSKINEMCFTADQLGVSEGQNIPLQVWVKTGFFDIFPTLWYFNYQSMDKYCYIDKPELATCMEFFPSNPSVGDEFIKCNNHYFWGGEKWFLDYTKQKPLGGEY